MLFRIFRWRRGGRRYPTIHRARNQSEYEQQLHETEAVNLRLRRYYKYHAQVRAEIGAEVEEAMLIPEEPHEALTQVQTQPTKILPSPFKTQPLEEE